MAINAFKQKRELGYKTYERGNLLLKKVYTLKQIKTTDLTGPEVK